MKIKSQLNLFVDLVLFIVLIPVFIARGEMHQVLGYLFGLMMIIHLVLHAKQIFALFQARFPLPKLRTVFVSTFCIICVVITIWSLGQGKKGHYGRDLVGRPPMSTEKWED